MRWPEAAQRIRTTIRVGTDLKTARSTNRPVVGIGPISDSRRYKYRDQDGFVVRIGITHLLSIPWSMVQECFDALQSAQGYDGTFFRSRFPVQALDHACHVHVVGQLLVQAGLAQLIDGRYVAPKRIPQPT